MKKSLFRHTALATVSRPAGFDVFGEPDYQVISRKTRINVIYMNIGITESSIRADRSESKARIEETAGKARFLVHPDDNIGNGDMVQVFGATLRVENVFPRHDLNGRLHHYQVDLEPWPESK